MDLEGLITPTDLHYTVQHFAVPPVVETDAWELEVGGEVKNPLTLNFDQLRRFPGRSVRTVMECSGSDAHVLRVLQGRGPQTLAHPGGDDPQRQRVDRRAARRRARTRPGSPPSRSTCGPRAAISGCRRLPPRAPSRSTTTRVCRSKRRSTPTPSWPGRRTVSCSSTCTAPRCGSWCRAGRATGRSSGSTKLELMEREPDCWYHYQFYYYGNSPDDPNKELITTIGVKSIITQPNDDTETLPPGIHMIRGYAWSGAGAIAQVEVSIDGGETWHAAHIEPPRERFMWVRWSYRWDARRRGRYTPDVACHRRGRPRAVARAALQQHAQELQRHHRPPGHGGVSHRRSGPLALPAGATHASKQGEGSGCCCVYGIT